MDQPKVGIYSVNLSNVSDRLKKIEELCQDARLTALEKIGQISEQAKNAREQLIPVLEALDDSSRDEC
jgi:hypothetical protein